ncbi:MAG: hypothetical protein ABSG86_07420 [Thermoguttaceae bacterium]|jgi:Spy/CpxP family protein refolding chaperone
MSNPYGPWATAINAGRNPQLSAFWRRRLAMLVPTSQTSPVLSRRNLLGLLAAAAMMLALPTFRSASMAANGPGEGVVKESLGGAKAEPNAAAPAAGKDYAPCAAPPAGSADAAAADHPPRPPAPGPVEIPSFPAYSELEELEMQSRLGLTAQQKENLREISRRFHQSTRRQKDAAEIRRLNKELTSGRPKAARAAWTEIQRILRQEVKDFCPQVESVLTPRQVDAYKKHLFPAFARYMLYDSENCKTLGLTAQQEEKLRQLRKADQERFDRLMRQLHEQYLAVLNPSQQEKLHVEAREQLAGREAEAEQWPPNPYGVYWDKGPGARFVRASTPG